MTVISWSTLLNYEGNCSNLNKVCNLLNESPASWYIRNMYEPHRLTRCWYSLFSNNKMQFVCKEHDITLPNMCMLKKHIQAKHLQDLWDLEFPLQEWSALFQNSSTIDKPVHESNCLAFPTTARNVKLLKKGCLDFSGLLNEEQIRLLCKGGKYVYYTKKEAWKVRQKTEDMAKDMGCIMNRNERRELDTAMKKLTEPLPTECTKCRQE